MILNKPQKPPNHSGVGSFRSRSTRCYAARCYNRIKPATLKFNEAPNIVLTVRSASSLTTPIGWAQLFRLHFVCEGVTCRSRNNPKKVFLLRGPGTPVSFLRSEVSKPRPIVGVGVPSSFRSTASSSNEKD